MSLEENEEDIKNLSGDEGASEAASSASEAAESSAAGDDVADLSDFDISEAGSDSEAEDDVTKNPEEASEAGASEALDTSVTHPASISKKTSSRKTSRKSSNKKGKKVEEETDDDDDDNEKEDYLQKFDKNFRNEFIKQYHPESNTHNYEQVKILTAITRDGERITDGIHKTLPFLTKYEMTRILGQRAKQLDSGAKPFVKIPLNVIDGYHIAKIELEQKKIPFIIKRPYPNGGVEYWSVSDLELI